MKREKYLETAELELRAWVALRDARADQLLAEQYSIELSDMITRLEAELGLAVQRSNTILSILRNAATSAEVSG